MIKKLNNFYKEYDGVIKFIFMVTPLIFASWKYLGTYIDVPDRMDAFEARAKRDSVHYAKIIYRSDSADRIHNKWLGQDADSIAKINRRIYWMKRKLKIN